MSHQSPIQKTQFKGVLMLLLTALIWGASFVAQSVGLDAVGSFTFNGIRTLMGVAVLAPFILIRDKRSARFMSQAQLHDRKLANKKALRYGLILGVVFCMASNFQQYSLNDSAPGKIAFITALYMFFVPFFGLFLKKKVPLLTWLCVLFGFVGLYFLCITPGDIQQAISKSDLLAIIGSVIFAIHILLIERYAPEVDGIRLSCIQFAVSGVLSCILMFLFEEPQLAAIKTAIIPLLYAGVMSCGIAYTFQIVGQKYTEATVASLILCTESVFGVLAAAVILHDTLSGREIFGCAIMFVAIVLSQLSEAITAKLKQRS